MMKKSGQETVQSGTPAKDGEQGYMLLGLIVAIFLILLALSVAASEMAKTIRRERERESARRADQYVRAIRRFYLKNGNRYPPSVKALENTNMIRYLREFKDPLTGKDFRVIVVGQNKTTPSGFFGQPLAGITSAGLGSAAGMQSSIPGAPGGAPGATTGITTGPAGATSALGASSSPFGSSSSLGGSSGLGSAAGMASPIGGGSGGAGPVMGVGTEAKGNSVLIVNGQDTYDMWEFLYDPRVEKLRAAAALNAGMGSANTNTLGQTPGSSNSNNTTSPNNPLGGGNPNSPFGSNTAAPAGGNPTGP